MRFAWLLIILLLSTPALSLSVQRPLDVTYCDSRLVLDNIATTGESKEAWREAWGPQVCRTCTDYFEEGCTKEIVDACSSCKIEGTDDLTNDCVFAAGALFGKDWTPEECRAIVSEFEKDYDDIVDQTTFTRSWFSPYYLVILAILGLIVYFVIRARRKE